MNSKYNNKLSPIVDFLKSNILKHLHILGETQHKDVIGGYIILLLNSYVYIAIAEHISEYLSKNDRKQLYTMLQNYIALEKYSPNCDFDYLIDFTRDLLGVDIKNVLITTFMSNWEKYLHQIEKSFRENKNSNQLSINSFNTEKDNIKRAFTKDPIGKFKNRLAHFKPVRAEVAHPHIQFRESQRQYAVEAVSFFIYIELLLLSAKDTLNSLEIKT